MKKINSNHRLNLTWALLTMVGLTVTLSYVFAGPGPNAIQYRIAGVVPSTSYGASICAPVQLNSLTVTVPGVLTDYDDKSGKAFLSRTEIRGGDNYQTNVSSCSSACPNNTSTFVLAFGDQCLNVLTLSNGCRRYELRSATLGISQKINCVTEKIRTPTITDATITISGCGTSGSIEFTMPRFGGVREAVHYEIMFQMSRGGIPQMPLACPSSTPR